MHILIAEDDPASRELATQILVHAGHEVHAVADGEAALDALLAGGLDLALIDLQLPGLDGAEVSRAARAARPDLSTRLVACSASLDPQVEAMLVAQGFDACLAKPFRPAALRALVGAALGTATAPPQPPPSTAPPLPPQPGFLASLVITGDPAALATAARALREQALGSGDPLLAGLCVRLERAVADNDQVQIGELAASIAALLDDRPA